MQTCPEIQLNPDSLPDFMPVGLVSFLAGMSQANLYRRIKLGQFPEPIRISTRKTGWKKNEILKFLSSCKVN